MKKTIILIMGAIITTLFFSACNGEEVKTGQANLIDGFVCPKVPVVRVCKNPANIVEGEKVKQMCQELYDNCPDLVYED